MNVRSVISARAWRVTIRAERLRHEAGALVETHSHSFGQLLVVTVGVLSLTTAEGWWVVPAGRAAWIPPGVAHEAAYSEQSEVLSVVWPAFQCATLPTQCRAYPASNLLRELCLEACRLAAGAISSSTIALIGPLIIELLLQPSLTPTFFLPMGRDKRLRRAIAFLQAQASRAVLLDEVAASVNSSGRTLERLFVAETGMTFTRWREQQRIILAVELLSKGHSITRAALDLGFQSPGSLSTLFTRVLGMPPSRFLRMLNSAG